VSETIVPMLALLALFVMTVTLVGGATVVKSQSVLPYGNVNIIGSGGAGEAPTSGFVFALDSDCECP
jgi:hypothetical protein